MATPGCDGNADSNAENASRPPAEAPTPTIGKEPFASAGADAASPWVCSADCVGLEGSFGGTWERLQRKCPSG